MPSEASLYLDGADALHDMAMNAGSPEVKSLYAARAQVAAIQAVAAALDRLAQAVGNLAGQAGQGRV